VTEVTKEMLQPGREPAPDVASPAAEPSDEFADPNQTTRLPRFFVERPKPEFDKSVESEPGASGDEPGK
jgi:hypothetical protein